MAKSLFLGCLLASLVACHTSKAGEATQPKQPTRAAPEAQVYRAPLLLFGPLLLVEVEDHGGQQHTFLLDTGASFSVLDTAVAEAFGAKPYVAEDGSTLSKKVSSASGKDVDLGQLQVMPSLKVGDFEFHGEVGAFIADLAPVRHVSGLNVRGILGFQSLQLPFTIDYPRNELRLNVEELREGQPGVVRLMENDALYSPNIQLEIGGRPGLALIDTGSGECMAIPADFGKTLPFLVAPAVTGFSQNIAGTTEDRSGRLKIDVQLAGHKVSEPIVDLIQPTYYRLGGALLKHFVITFDPEKSLVRFARTSKEPTRCESVRSIGFYVGRTQDDTWVVALILPGAEGRGIEPGDQLLTIEGKEVTSMTKVQMKKQWIDLKKITVTLKRGNEIIERVVPVRTLVP
jgi:hypothetical protein